MAPPPAGFTGELLEAAVRKAAQVVAVTCPPINEDHGVTLIARWGEQLDVRHITEASVDERELSAEQVAGYIAKYATKATEALGVTLDHRIGEAELDDLDVPAHVAELVRVCFELGNRPSLAPLRLRKWRTCWLRGPLLDQEPPLLDHPGRPATGSGRLRHPLLPRQRPAVRYLGAARGRPGRDRRRLLALPRPWLSVHRRGVAGRLSRRTRPRRAADRQGGATHYDHDRRI